MNMILGSAMATVGVFTFISGTMKSKFFLSELLVARARMFWGDAENQFFHVVGVILAVMGDRGHLEIDARTIHGTV